MRYTITVTCVCNALRLPLLIVTSCSNPLVSVNDLVENLSDHSSVLPLKWNHKHDNVCEPSVTSSQKLTQCQVGSDYIHSVPAATVRQVRWLHLRFGTDWMNAAGDCWTQGRAEEKQRVEHTVRVRRRPNKKMRVIDTRAYLRNSFMLIQSCVHTCRTGTSYDLKWEGVCELFYHRVWEDRQDRLSSVSPELHNKEEKENWDTSHPSIMENPAMTVFT